MGPGFLFSAVLALAPSEASGSLAQVSTEILADPAYAFCHDPQYPLTPDEVQWCPVLARAQEEELERCPAFAHACDASRAVLKGEGRLSSRSVEDEAQAEQRAQGRGPSRGSKDREQEDEDAIEIPVLGGLAEVLFWTVIGLALLLLVVAIVRNLAQSRAPEPEPEPDVPTGSGVGLDGAEAAAAARAMETDVERLLSMARDCAQRGAFSDAVDFSHAALLRRLDHEGLIRLHASRTNGEYVRELRGNASLVDPVRDALRRVDRAQFGPQGAGASVFDDIHARVVAIVKTVGPLVLLLTTVLGMSIACDTESARVFPWSTSPSGNAGVMELMRSRGLEVSYRAEALTALDVDDPSSDPVIVMLASASATEPEWDALQTWVRNGGTLLIAGGQLPPWLDVAYVASQSVEGDEVSMGASGQPTAAPVEDDSLEDYEDHRAPDYGGADFYEAYGFEPDPLALTGVLPLGRSLEAGETADDVAVDQNEAVTFASFGRGLGRVEVFADGRLFTNAALAFEDNDDAILASFRSDAESVEFVDGWVGRGADSPADTIRNSHLTAAVVQLLLLILVFYLWRGRQFGRGRDPISRRRRAFSQHAVAMGRQYEKARAASFAARLFSGWVLERLRNRFSSAAGAGLLGLSQEVARRSGRDETEVMRLLLAAHTATESVATPGGTAQDLTLVRDLGRLMREIGETT